MTEPGIPNEGSSVSSLPVLIDGLYVYDEDTNTYRLPKASDISDLAFLSKMRRWGPTFIEDLTTEIGFPRKVVLAKARRLVHRELIDGCCCGKCDGYFMILPEGYLRIYGR
jgi:hypothetical protein